MMTLLFLAVISILPFVTLKWVGGCRRDQAERMFRDSDGNYEAVDAPAYMFLPLVATSLITIAWYLLTPNAAAALDAATPSYATSNWIWTTVAAFVITFPLGTPLFMLIQLLYIRPANTLTTTAIALITLCQIGILVWVYGNVYSPWLIYFPVVSWTLVSYSMWPQTSEEKADTARTVAQIREERVLADIEREKRWQRFKEEHKAARKARSSRPEKSTFPKRYVINTGNGSVTVTQRSKYSDIDYIDDEGREWSKIGSDWHCNG